MIALTYMATMMSTFGAIALLLAAVGIYGVMSYSVSQRRHEIGIRMALGAGSRHVIQLVLGRVARLLIIGVAFGLIFAYGTSRVIVSALESVGSMDALTFAAFAVFLSLVALAAGYVPTRRALRVDPVAALRVE